jgi:hypothetical protein
MLLCLRRVDYKSWVCLTDSAHMAGCGGDHTILKPRVSLNNCILCSYTTLTMRVLHHVFIVVLLNALASLLPSCELHVCSSASITAFGPCRMQLCQVINSAASVM